MESFVFYIKEVKSYVPDCHKKVLDSKFEYLSLPCLSVRVQLATLFRCEGLHGNTSQLWVSVSFKKEQIKKQSNWSKNVLAFTPS